MTHYKVEEALRDCLKNGRCRQCAYNKKDWVISNRALICEDLMKDALELIAKQEKKKTYEVGAIIWRSAYNYPAGEWIFGVFFEDGSTMKAMSISDSEVRKCILIWEKSGRKIIYCDEDVHEGKYIMEAEGNIYITHLTVSESIALT